MLLSILLQAAAGLTIGKLGAALGAGLAAIGAGIGIGKIGIGQRYSNQYDHYRSPSRGCCTVRRGSLLPGSVKQ